MAEPEALNAPDARERDSSPSLNAEEMADHGTAYPMRFKKMGEQVEAVRNRTHRSSSSARLHGRAAGEPLWRGLDPARRRRKRRRSSRQRPAFSPDGRRGRPRSALFVCHGGGALEYPDLLKRYRDLGIARVNFRCLPRTEMK